MPDKPKRREDGTLMEQPEALKNGRPKGSRNKVNREIIKVLADEQEGGIKFIKLLFKGANKCLEAHLKDPQNVSGKTFLVQIAAAFMLKNMPSLRQIEADVKIQGVFEHYYNFIEWSPIQKEEFIVTGKLPPPPQRVEDDE